MKTCSNDNVMQLCLIVIKRTWQICYKYYEYTMHFPQLNQDSPWQFLILFWKMYLFQTHFTYVALVLVLVNILIPVPVLDILKISKSCHFLSLYPNPHLYPYPSMSMQPSILLIYDTRHQSGNQLRKEFQCYIIYQSLKIRLTKEF